MASEVICLLVLDGCLRNREKEVLQEVVTCDLQELGASEGPVCVWPFHCSGSREGAVVGRDCLAWS